MQLEKGARLGPYQIEELVGEGAMGVVYRAYHADLARPAAVKLISALGPDTTAAARFKREGQAIAQLRHPNILNIFDFGEYQGAPYLVVEYVPGGSLAKRLVDKHPQRWEAMKMLAGIAAGIDYAHGRGIIHRDIKPANVLLGQDDTPILADFGLAKLLQQASMTMSGMTTGTPAYMAPEQVTGEAVGPAADRYSFAAMAYELLTGSLPFSADNVMELLYAQVNKEPDPPSLRNPGLPAAVDAVLLRALAKKPEARWETCAAMVRELSRALGEGAQAGLEAPLEAVPAGPPPAARRPRWQLGPLQLGALLALVLALGLVAGYILTRTPAADAVLGASHASAGESVSLKVTGLRAGTWVQVYIESERTLLASYQADSRGSVNADVRVPADQTAGDHQLVVCWGGSCPRSFPLLITRRLVPPSPSPPASPSPLPSPTAPPVYHQTLTIAPNPVHLNHTVTIAGAGFDPNLGGGFVKVTQAGHPDIFIGPGQTKWTAGGSFAWTGLPPNQKVGTQVWTACQRSGAAIVNCTAPVTLTLVP